MNTIDPPIHRDQTVGALAATRAGASRVFHRHGLDFCCGGQRTLADACERLGEDPAVLLHELVEEVERRPDDRLAWEGVPLPQLIDHVLERYHAPHRTELPRLVAMARKVEDAHGLRPDCPQGLSVFLEGMATSLEEHMQKEEQVLFPMLLAGRGRHAGLPIQCMEEEHQDHGKNLERLHAMTTDFVAPRDACNTWRALYLGLEEFELELMQHIHLENNVLFPRALRG
jgi:regulator of cell morphogenesis and NO signaling